MYKALRTELRRLLTASEMKAAKTDKTVNVKSVNVYTPCYSMILFIWFCLICTDTL